MKSPRRHVIFLSLIFLLKCLSKSVDTFMFKKINTIRFDKCYSVGKRITVPDESDV